MLAGPDWGSQCLAGYLTEKALSVDNLFVFVAVMAGFAVPREYQQKVRLFGIVFSLIARTGLIFLGATLIDAFSWTFSVFGAILIFTAIHWCGRAATTPSATTSSCGWPAASSTRPTTTTATG